MNYARIVYVQMKLFNLTEFRREASRFVKDLTPSEDRATLVGLYGDLGAGKTTFVQAVAKALGVFEHVTSPTFLIYRTYNLQPTTNNGKFKTLVHVDAYRLKNTDELRKLRFEELLADSKNFILVEWADKVTDLLPKDHQKLYFEFIDEHTRSVRA